MCALKKPGAFVYFILFLVHLYIYFDFFWLFKNHFCFISYSFLTCFLYNLNKQQVNNVSLLKKIWESGGGNPGKNP